MAACRGDMAAGLARNTPHARPPVLASSSKLIVYTTDREGGTCKLVYSVACGHAGGQEGP